MGRRDLSLGQYSITKLQYRELHNFCLQYPDKKRRLAELRAPHRDPRTAGSIKGGDPNRPTGRSGELAARLMGELELIDRTAAEICPEEARNLVLAVTEDVPWHFLQLLKGMRMGRNRFDQARRGFFRLLAQKKGMI